MCQAVDSCQTYVSLVLTCPCMFSGLNRRLLVSAMPPQFGINKPIDILDGYLLFYTNEHPRNFALMSPFYLLRLDFRTVEKPISYLNLSNRSSLNSGLDDPFDLQIGYSISKSRHLTKGGLVVPS